MDIHVRVVGALWVLVGLALGGLARWGLIYEEHSRTVVESWLIALAFALACIAAGFTFGRTGLLGRILVRIVSTLALLYSAAWLLLGGVDDASGYWPAIVFGTTLSIYALFSARRGASAA
jgi:hypothetical protein